jgi:hypothetical protein
MQTSNFSLGYTLTDAQLNENGNNRVNPLTAKQQIPAKTALAQFTMEQLLILFLRISMRRWMGL